MLVNVLFVASIPMRCAGGEYLCYQIRRAENAGVKEYWIVSTAEKSVEQYLLQDGRFVLANTYTQYPDYLLEDMTEEELAALVTEFKCSLYDDLLIKLADIFEYVD